MDTREHFFYREIGQMLAQSTERGCGVSIHRDIQNPRVEHLHNARQLLVTTHGSNPRAPCSTASWQQSPSPPQPCPALLPGWWYVSFQGLVEVLASHWVTPHSGSIPQGTVRFPGAKAAGEVAGEARLALPDQSLPSQCLRCKDGPSAACQLLVRLPRSSALSRLTLPIVRALSLPAGAGQDGRAEARAGCHRQDAR